ncbi:MAG: NAD(+)/NADH kinase [Candidatus Moranbacteria bacterium]|nr:NAD(+)/NADH kinase [Candidatus Moranbacteria bacterium]
MGKSKLFLVPSNDPRSADVKSWFAGDRFQVVNKPSQADFLIVSSGDGGILEAVPKYYMHGVPIIGINRGTRGFLLNPVDDAEQFERLLGKKLDIIPMQLLRATFVTRSGKEREFLVFNDAYVKAESGSVVEGVIRGEKYPEKIFRGDGIIVATAQGSTAYNLSAGGSVQPLDSDHLSIRTICASAGTQPIRNAINPQRLQIDITKGKAIGHADTKRKKVIDVVRVVIEPSPFQVRLAFDPDIDFQAKRYL